MLSIIVLYSVETGLWKITDFGITADATSKQAHTTRLARGTASYRAPELLAEVPQYTNKVDIWALGCILYELAFSRRAFVGDWEVYMYRLQQMTLMLPSSSLPDVLQGHLSDNLYQLLARDGPERPRASDLRRMYICYCQLLNCWQDAIETYVPPFQLWKELIYASSDEPDVVCRILTESEKNGINVTQGWIKLVSKNPNSVTLHEELARSIKDQGNDDAATIWKNLVCQHPENREFQTRLANLYLTTAISNPIIFHSAIWMATENQQPGLCELRRQRYHAEKPRTDSSFVYLSAIKKRTFDLAFRHSDYDLRPRQEKRRPHSKPLPVIPLWRVAPECSVSKEGSKVGKEIFESQQGRYYVVLLHFSFQAPHKT